MALSLKLFAQALLKMPRSRRESFPPSVLLGCHCSCSLTGRVPKRAIAPPLATIILQEWMRWWTKMGNKIMTCLWTALSEPPVQEGSKPCPRFSLRASCSGSELSFCAKRFPRTTALEHSGYDRLALHGLRQQFVCYRQTRRSLPYQWDENPIQNCARLR